MTKLSALVQEFKRAVSNDNLEAASDTIEQIQKTYSSRQPKRSRQLQQALLLRNRAARSEKSQLVGHTYVETTATTQLAWSDLLTITPVFLAHPDGIDKGKILSSAETVVEMEGELEANTSDLNSAVADVDLPPKVAMLALRTPDSPILTGESFNAQIVIGNIGDGLAKDIHIETQGDTGLKIDPPPVLVGSLEAGASTSRGFSLIGKNPGGSSLTFRLSSENTKTVIRQEFINIHSKTAFLSRQNESVDQERFAPFNTEDRLDWLALIGGAGALGLGAGTYGYLRKVDDEKE